MSVGWLQKAKKEENSEDKTEHDMPSLQISNMKWPNSKFYVEREHTTVIFFFLPELQRRPYRVSSPIVRIR